MSSDPLRVGVIGAGVMGADHARTLSSAVAGARLAAVADVDGERAREAAGGDAVAAYSDAFALVADAGVDAVVVASSDATHEDYVLACLAAGKPVLCEKPLAPTVAACRRVVDAEVAGGRRLVSVGFMRRYDPGYLQAKQLVADGELGAVLLVHHVHRNVSQPPGVPSEVLVTGSAVHEIDVTRWLLGEEIVAVTARLPRRSSLVTGDTRDPQFLVLETASGVVVDIEVFANAHYGYDVRCELVCERGALTVGGPRPLDVRLDQRDYRPVALDWRDRFADAYRAELQDWVAATAAGRTCAASAWDGLMATVVAEAAVAVLTTGARGIVDVPGQPAFYDAGSPVAQ